MTPPSPSSPAGGAVEVRAATTRTDRAAFIDLPYRAYRDLPAWRAPLRFERRAQLDPARNPALAQIDHALFLARRDGRVVGRIAAIVNHAHLQLHHATTGHFGFLDTLAPDPEAVAALIGAAGTWLRTRGMTRIQGPFNFTVNEESGLLIEGFDTPPMIMTPHGRPDYAPALEALGFTKVIDSHAYLYDFGARYTIPPRVQRLLAGFEKDSALSLRPLDLKNFDDEIRLVMDIFNDAWADNWNFVPFSEAQISAMAQELRPLVRGDSLWIAMINGEPAAFCLFLPDINEIAHGLDGRVLPFGWARILYRLKLRGPKRARLPLAGVRRKFHKTQGSILAMAAVFEKGFAAQYARGAGEIEASWVLETNRDMISMINLIGMRRYKTYRIYEKPL